MIIQITYFHYCTVLSEIHDTCNCLYIYNLYLCYKEGQLSFEEAIISKRQCIQNTREAAQKFREESQELMRQYFSQRKEEQLQMRRLVEATMNGYKNTQDARDKLTNMKQKIGLCVVQYTITSFR